MAGANPALIVRVTGNLDDLVQTLDASKIKVQETTAAVEKVSAQFGGMSESAGRVLTTQEKLRTSLGQFDGILSSVGVNIGTKVRALDELAGASTKTAGQLGALSTAGLVVGTAIAGWEIGRAIANVFGLDEAVGHLTGSFQDLKNQTVAAQQDTINKAIAEGATNVRTYADAVKFLNDKWNQQLEAQKAFKAGMEAITLAGDNWQKTLDTIDGSVVEAVKFYLDAGVSQEKLAGAYGLTAVQIRAVAKSREDDIAVMKLQQEMDKTTFELAQQHEKQWREEIEKTKNARNQATAEGIQKTRAAEIELADFIAKQTLSTTEYEKKQINDRLDAELASYDQSAGGFQRYAAARTALHDQMIQGIIQKEQAAANAAVQAEIDAINALNAIIPNIGHGPTTPNGQGPPPIVIPPIIVGSVFHGRASGGPVSAGAPYMVGERGPELFVPRSSGSIVPNGGSATTVTNIYVTQPLGTPQQIAAAIDDATMQRQRAIGTRF